MNDLKLPLIIIGFKSVGKTVVGRALATHLELPFIDLDQALEAEYFARTNQALSCRQIVHKEGIGFFRKFESAVLNKIMKKAKGVLALGGGTPMCAENQALMGSGSVIHLQARKGLVFERMMLKGRPAFFPEGEEAFDAFERIWNEREPVYQALADFHTENTQTIDQAVLKIVQKIQERTPA